MAQILVTAGEGRLTPIPFALATGPGGTMIRLSPGDLVEVDEAHPYTQRALRNGDFVRVNPSKE